MSLEFRPLIPERWPDFENLFGERGACGGCWCMWWRLKRSEYEKMKGAQNRKAMQAIVKSGQIPGLLGYFKDEPVAWCAVRPREEFSALERSRILKPVDAQSVWSIVCFFVAKSHRRTGVSVELLEATKKYVRDNGGPMLEGYPVEPKDSSMPDAFAWTGTSSAFRKAGFKEILRRSETRPIMRYPL